MRNKYTHYWANGSTVSHKNIKLYSRCLLADCGKTRGIPQIKKGTILDISPSENPIAVRVEDK